MAEMAVMLRPKAVTRPPRKESLISGSVTVACDRCLEDLELPVVTSFEESYVPDGAELDLSQDVYDYVCISLPLKRVHPDQGCNQETVGYLSE